MIHFDTLENVFSATKDELMLVDGVGPVLATAIHETIRATIRKDRSSRPWDCHSIPVIEKGGRCVIRTRGAFMRARPASRRLQQTRLCQSSFDKTGGGGEIRTRGAFRRSFSGRLQ